MLFGSRTLGASLGTKKKQVAAHGKSMSGSGWDQNGWNPWSKSWKRWRMPKDAKQETTTHSKIAKCSAKPLDTNHKAKKWWRCCKENIRAPGNLSAESGFFRRSHKYRVFQASYPTVTWMCIPVATSGCYVAKNHIAGCDGIELRFMYVYYWCYCIVYLYIIIAGII